MTSAFSVHLDCESAVGADGNHPARGFDGDADAVVGTVGGEDFVPVADAGPVFAGADEDAFVGVFAVGEGGWALDGWRDEGESEEEIEDRVENHRAWVGM